jgi:UDP-glucuronate decarboxylase
LKTVQTAWEHNQVYNEVARIFADVLKVNHIHVFCTDSTGQWLRLVSSVGGVKYAKSIQTSQYDFLSTVIKDHTLFINRDLVPEYPLVCAPICLGDQIEAIVFIDGIEFISLTQHFINTLKALTVLVSESIERKARYEGAVRNDKYFDNTYILKRQWFEKSIHDKTESSQHRILLLRINNEIHNYRNFNRIVNNLIRSVDSVGEIARGQLGIILIDTDRKYLPIIQARFSEKGFSIDLMETEVR